jgi:hypothetical protein
MSRLLAFTFVAAIAAVACSGEDDNASNGGGALGPAAGCAADTRKDIYTAGMTKPAGQYQVKIVESIVDSNPSPPVKAKMTIMVLEIADANGQPVDGATVTVAPFMPDHGHGSARPVVVKPQGNGRYEASEIWLSMAGLWTLTVSIQPAGGGPTQQAVFSFCLDG